MRVATPDLRGLGSLGNALVRAAHILGGGLVVRLDVRENGGVAPVGVDANAFLPVLEADIVDLDVALMRGGAVSAATVEFTEIGGEEVVDLYCPGTVVLEDFVGSVEGTTPVNSSDIVGTGLFDSGGIFANIFPPNIGDSAWATAMNAFRLIFANDDVRDGRSGFQDKDSIFFSSFVLTLTFAAASGTVKSHHASVKGARYDSSGREGGVASRGRQSSGDTGRRLHSRRWLRSRGCGGAYASRASRSC